MRDRRRGGSNQGARRDPTTVDTAAVSLAAILRSAALFSLSGRNVTIYDRQSQSVSASKWRPKRGVTEPHRDKSQVVIDQLDQFRERSLIIPALSFSLSLACARARALSFSLPACAIALIFGELFLTRSTNALITYYVHFYAGVIHVFLSSFCRDNSSLFTN